MTIQGNTTRRGAPILISVSLVSMSALLAGCMSSPTYGTDKTASEQLLEDVTGILAIGPKDNAQIDYKPRPELVTPASTAVLPEPQQDIASAGNSAWPESPEQRRARIRAEATENQHNPAYRPQVRPGAPASGERGLAWAEANNPERASMPMANNPQRRAEIQARVRERNQGSATTRQYLSEPPLAYRQPAETAAANDPGQDEWVKARQRRNASGKSSWRDWIPGL